MYSDFLTFRLDQTSALLIERANAVYRERWDLDVRALRVLRIICATPGIAPKAVSQLALIEKTLLSKTLGELESRGLIRRGKHAADRRSVTLRVTPEGSKVANASEKAGSKLESELAAVLTDQERKMLDQLLAKLAQSLSDGA